MNSTTGSTESTWLHLHTIRDVDLEIANLEARIISLKSRRNSLAPISRLHPEILQEIFTITQFTSQDKGKVALLLTWISHHWRDLAHQTSDLWTYIDLLHPDWISAALSRTGDRELEFRLNGDPSHSILQLCLQNLPRIRKLNIDGSSEPCVEWGNPAPRLVELTFWEVRVPDNLFSGECPSLTDVSFSYCDFNWDSFRIPPNLTTFWLSSPTQKPTVDQIVPVLQRIAPSLESLTIQRGLVFLSTPTQNTHISSHRIPFHHIRNIHIHESHPAVFVELLRHISLPSLSNFHIILNARWERRYWLMTAQELVLARGLSRWEIDSLQFVCEEGQCSLNVSRETTNGDSSRGSGNLSINPDVGIPTQSIESVYFAVGELDSEMFDYFETKTTVHKLIFDTSSLPSFQTLVTSQLHQLSTFAALPVNQGGIHLPPSLLNEETKTTARNILTFHDLRILELQTDLLEVHVNVLKTWLTWRNAAGFPRLEKLITMTLLDHSFEELVDEVQLFEPEAEE